MLQYVLTESEKWSVGELAQMAIEGGCMWITLHLPRLTDAEIRELIEPDIIEMCREASVFLTIDDRPELTRELGLHGVRLSLSYFITHPESTPLSLREELGPEAVIGVECVDASFLPEFVPADLDFITLPSTVSQTERERFLTDAKRGRFSFPVVAEGARTIDDALAAMADGCSGVAIGWPITDSRDPVSATRDFLDALHQ